MDDIGFGNILLNFSYVCSGGFFVIAILIAKLVAKRSLSTSLIIALIFAVIGYFTGPYIYFDIFSFLGYSF